jgi:hypothetical protein
MVKKYLTSPKEVYINWKCELDLTFIAVPIIIKKEVAEEFMLAVFFCELQM